MTAPDYISFQRTELADALALLRDVDQPAVEPVVADLSASIILVNYNGWHDLERCLQSLENTRPAGCEVIVIDNCSTDDSPKRIAERFPTVRLVRSAINLGFGAGNNLGAKLAQGKVLVFLNPDTTVEPGWLEPLLAALDADPKVGMATPRILLMTDPQRINTSGNDVHVSGLALCREMGRTIAACPANAVKPVAAVSGAAFVIRRELFETIGGFDETFFLYMEDTDLSMRVRLAGYTCVFVPASTIYHDYELSFGQMKVYYEERNRYLMLLKLLRWPTLLALIPPLVVAEVVTWGYVLWRDRARIRNKLFAYTWVIFWWQQIMEKRAETQRLRRVRDRDLLHMTTARIDFGQAGSGWVTRLAHVVFDPLFSVLRWAALALVWW